MCVCVSLSTVSDGFSCCPSRRVGAHGGGRVAQTSIDVRSGPRAHHSVVNGAPREVAIGKVTIKARLPQQVRTAATEFEFGEPQIRKVTMGLEPCKEKRCEGYMAKSIYLLASAPHLRLAALACPLQLLVASCAALAAAALHPCAIRLAQDAARPTEVLPQLHERHRCQLRATPNPACSPQPRLQPPAPPAAPSTAQRPATAITHR